MQSHTNSPNHSSLLTVYAITLPDCMKCPSSVVNSQATTSSKFLFWHLLINTWSSNSFNFATDLVSQHTILL